MKKLKLSELKDWVQENKFPTIDLELFEVNNKSILVYSIQMSINDVDIEMLIHWSEIEQYFIEDFGAININLFGEQTLCLPDIDFPVDIYFQDGKFEIIESLITKIITD
jgi:hypothetical protein